MKRILFIASIIALPALLTGQTNYHFNAVRTDMKHQGKTFSQVSNLGAHDGHIYMAANNSSLGYHLFRSNIQEMDFIKIELTEPNLSGQTIIGVDSLDTDHVWLLKSWNSELYALNIRTMQTQLLCSGVQSSIVLFDGKLFFAKGTDSYGTDSELWVATKDGAYLYADIATGVNGSGNPRSSSPHAFFVYNHRLWFIASDEQGEVHYYSTNGSDAPQKHLSKKYIEETFPASGLSNGVEYEGEFWFISGYANSSTSYLMASNGTSAGTRSDQSIHDVSTKRNCTFLTINYG
jgi:hypothetical protein